MLDGIEDFKSTQARLEIIMVWSKCKALPFNLILY